MMIVEKILSEESERKEKIIVFSLPLLLRENQRPRKVTHDDGKHLYFKFLKWVLKKEHYKG
jgi:hypothetical protein